MSPEVANPFGGEAALPPADPLWSQITVAAIDGGLSEAQMAEIDAVAFAG
jgi:hypothetical protein